METIFDFAVIAVLVFCVFRIKDLGYEITRLRFEHVLVIQEIRGEHRPPGLQPPPKRKVETVKSMEERGPGTGKPAS